MAGRRSPVVPYSFRQPTTSRLQRGGDFATGEEFFRYNRDAFDWLYRQGREGRPRMCPSGCNARVIGRPGSIGALERLLDHMLGHEGVWFCSRAAIRRHWTENFRCHRPDNRGSGLLWELSLRRNNAGRRSVMSQ